MSLTTSLCMICEKSRKEHSRKLWKLHVSLENNPELKMRDPAMVKRLIAWQQMLFTESCRDPIEVIEGTVTLEQLGEKWNAMRRDERALLLRRVNLEEHLLGNTSLPAMSGFNPNRKDSCPLALDDKYHNNANLKKTWNKFSDEDKEKMHRAYNWDFSYRYYDEEKECDVLYSTFLDKYRATEQLIDEGEFSCTDRWCYCQEKMVPCQKCGQSMGDLEKEHSEVLGEMCLQCFRELTDQTHPWYDIPPIIKRVNKQ